ncbi:O-methyltransferase [Haloactinomyces albus]|uniref:O-methyltransferase YrrM n=1 Tax=Haloactinomyces albus TaxID=1352928 RepID=A0AAE3ZDE3_9ACTN|nr:class I SAM-dependent methyltransferase [Haloactinomyces albus]MDR7302837.1 putative O-methyltransferase YrrM [Haloactinomyces albus]
MIVFPEKPTDNEPAGRNDAGRRGADSGVVSLRGNHAGSAEASVLPVSTGATLRFLTSVLRARAVVEVGTGSGATALSLLEGMAADGLLTSIDLDPDAQRTARAALTEAGVPGNRTRLITGVAQEVLLRLTEGAYDLVLIDATKPDYSAYLEPGKRLLRPGGTLVFRGIVPDSDLGDPARRNPGTPRTAALHELLRAVHADPSLVPVALPVEDGLLAIART